MKKILKRNKKPFWKRIFGGKNHLARNFVKIHSSKGEYDYIERLRETQWRYHKNVKGSITRYKTIKKALEKKQKNRTVDAREPIDIWFKNPGKETKFKQDWDAELDSLERGIYYKGGRAYQVPRVGEEIKRRNRAKWKKRLFYGGLILLNGALIGLGAVSTWAALAAYGTLNLASAAFRTASGVFGTECNNWGGWEQLQEYELRYQQYMGPGGPGELPDGYEWLEDAHNSYVNAVFAQNTVVSSQEAMVQNQMTMNKEITKLSTIGAIFATEGAGYAIKKHMTKKHTGNPGGSIDTQGYERLFEMENKLKKENPDYKLVEFHLDRLEPLQTKVTQNVNYKKSKSVSSYV